MIQSLQADCSMVLVHTHGHTPTQTRTYKHTYKQSHTVTSMQSHTESGKKHGHTHGHTYTHIDSRFEAHQHLPTHLFTHPYTHKPSTQAYIHPSTQPYITRTHLPIHPNNIPPPWGLYRKLHAVSDLEITKPIFEFAIFEKLCSFPEVAWGNSYNCLNKLDVGNWKELGEDNVQ